MINPIVFTPAHLKSLHQPDAASSKSQNGQVTIIGGSDLFHGAPLLALKTISRFSDMVFFASPEPSIGEIALKLKSQLSSFIWIPLDEVGEYIKKSDSILIGPGLKRYHKETDPVHSSPYDKDGTNTKFLTEKLLREFPEKQWVIDAGSLQVANVKLIPQNAILTPNQKEFTLLFRENLTDQTPEQIITPLAALAQKYHCIIVYKTPTAIITDGESVYLAQNGNPGLTKGGTGDILASLAAAFAAKNPPLLSAAAATFILKAAADDLFQKVGTNYNADDLAGQIPSTLHHFLRLP